MFEIKNETIIMTEGDFGLDLPIEIIGTELASDETIKLTIRDNSNETKIEKEFSGIIDNTVSFSLTETESKKLRPNIKYFYRIDWYKNGQFLGNVVNGKEFIVKEKK
jgi:hypothetical protein